MGRSSRGKSLSSKRAREGSKGCALTFLIVFFVVAAMVSLGVVNNLHRGRVWFIVPQHAVRTFTAPNNRIVWRLRVRGDIKQWPDVNDEFEIIVIGAPAQCGTQQEDLA